MPYETQERVKKQSGGLFLGETLVGGFPLTFFSCVQFFNQGLLFRHAQRRGIFLSVFVSRIGCLTKLLYKKFLSAFFKMQGVKGTTGTSCSIRDFPLLRQAAVEKSTFRFFARFTVFFAAGLDYRPPTVLPPEGRPPPGIPPVPPFIPPPIPPD